MPKIFLDQVTSGAKIQLEYDLFSGYIIENYLGAEKEGDKHFSDTLLSPILPGNLCIRDLGYFDLKENIRRFKKHRDITLQE